MVQTDVTVQEKWISDIGYLRCSFGKSLERVLGFAFFGRIEEKITVKHIEFLNRQLHPKLY